MRDPMELGNVGETANQLDITVERPSYDEAVSQIAKSVSRPLHFYVNRSDKATCRQTALAIPRHHEKMMRLEPLLEPTHPHVRSTAGT
jgi:hypothetical protein